MFATNFLLGACWCWDDKFCLREMDQKFEFGGTTGFGDSYLVFLFCHFNVFRLHSKLHVAAGLRRSHSVKGLVTDT